jgi:hypothetical protein
MGKNGWKLRGLRIFAFFSSRSARGFYCALAALVVFFLAVDFSPAAVSSKHGRFHTRYGRSIHPASAQLLQDKYPQSFDLLPSQTPSTSKRTLRG